ncbi:MAG TPA: hypothetical protein VGP88_03055, partial [Thermoplasmata archaeon]|nr:hypothetical protein [Thermoplasmata archaeon]
RSAHPSVVLHTLLEPGKRAAALAADLEAPLRRIHESDGGPPTAEPSGPAASTASTTAATSWLVDLIGDAVGQVWFLGDESAWFAPGASVERELAERGRRSSRIQIRMLVPPADLDGSRRAHHERLAEVGVDVRYSTRFHAPTVIVDSRWLLVRNGAAPAGTGKTPTYLRLDSPGLSRDLLSAGEDAWSRSGAVPSGGPGPTADAPRAVHPESALPVRGAADRRPRPGKSAGRRGLGET